MTREQFRLADVRVLDMLDTPGTTKEIAHRLYRLMVESWAEGEGVYDVEWNEMGLPQAGYRLAAVAWGREHGMRYLGHMQVYRRLLKLEKLGLVQRLKLPSHSRSVMWFRPLSTTARGLCMDTSA